MDFIKKHKLTTFIILVYIVLIGFLFFIYNMFIGSSGMPVYGDRLDGIENVPITKEQQQAVVTELTKDPSVVSVVEPVLSGKTLNVIITVGDKVEENNAKALAAKVKALLTEEQNKFYDVQVFITKDYNCSLTTTGLMDEDGNFTSQVTVTFENDLSKNANVLDYGISTNATAEYNKNQKIDIIEDGTVIVYGYTKDKVGESVCSLKFTKKTTEEKGVEQKINSSLSENFPIIGYKRKGKNDFVWTKSR